MSRQVGEAGCRAYAAILADLVARGVVGRHDSILLPFAGAFDRSIARALGLTNCCFAAADPSSSSPRSGGQAGDPHRSGFADASFDHVVGHAGLRRCTRPHQALYEMYRVARATVVAVEDQDSPLVRLAGRTRLARVPEPVGYRWTRHEVRKTVGSFDPGHDVPIEFRSEWLSGTGRARALAAGLNTVARSQGNVVGFTVRKDLARVRPGLPAAAP